MEIDNIDKFCIIQSNGLVDCGDLVNYHGHYNYLTLPKDLKCFSARYEVKKTGGYVRCPDPNMTNYGFGAFYLDHIRGCITRDQMVGILLGLHAQKDIHASLRFIDHHSKRNFLRSYSMIKRGEDIRDGVIREADFTGPEIWQMEMRLLGLNGFTDWTIVYLCDIWMLLSAVFDRLNNDDDNITFLGQVIVCLEQQPTKVSWLIKKVMNLDQQLAKLNKYWKGWRNKHFMVDLYLNKLKNLGVK